MEETTCFQNKKCGTSCNAFSHMMLRILADGPLFEGAIQCPASLCAICSSLLPSSGSMAHSEHTSHPSVACSICSLARPSQTDMQLSLRHCTIGGQPAFRPTSVTLEKTSVGYRFTIVRFGQEMSLARGRLPRTWGK